MTEVSMEKFVKDLFRLTPDLSQLTQRKVREKYLEHCQQDCISEDAKLELKGIVAKLVKEKLSEQTTESNGLPSPKKAKKENGKNKRNASNSSKSSPRRSSRTPSPQKRPSTRDPSPPSTVDSTSTLSSWARTPPPKPKTGAVKRVTADQALKAVLESSPEKSPRKASPRKSPRKKPQVPLPSPRRSPRKAVKKADAGKSNRRLSADEARDKILDANDGEDDAVNLLDDEEDDDEEETTDDEYNPAVESSGSKKTKWRSPTRAARRRNLPTKIESSDGDESSGVDEPMEPFRDEAPLGTYNSSDTDISDSEESDIEPEKSPEKNGDAQSSESEADDKFAKLKKKRAKRTSTKSKGGKNSGPAEIFLKRRGHSASDDDSSFVELLSQDSQVSESESNASPVKAPVSRLKSRSRVISDSESNCSSPAKPARKKVKAKTKRKAKTILDVDSGDESDNKECNVKSSPKVNGRKNSKSSVLSSTDTSDSETEGPTKKVKAKVKRAKPATNGNDKSENNDEFFASPLKENKKKKTEKRKRETSSEGSESDSASKSKSKKQKKAAKPPSKKAENEDPTKTAYIRSLEKIAREAGGILPVGKKYKETFQVCKTSKQRAQILLRLFEEAGMKGTPSMKQAKIFKLKREAAELDQNVILTGGRGARSSRNKVNYGEPVKPVQTKPCRVRLTPFKNKLSNLADLIDSEGSDSD